MTMMMIQIFEFKCQFQIADTQNAHPKRCLQMRESCNQYVSAGITFPSSGRLSEVYLVRCANSVESEKSCLSLLRSAIHALRGARGRAAGAASTSARGSRAHAAAARGATQIQTSRCRRTQCVLARSSTKCPTPVGRELTVQT